MRRGACNKPKLSCSRSCGSPHRTEGWDSGRRKWRLMESPGNDGACFPPFPQTLEIARRVHRKMNIKRNDSHIPSAPTTASLNDRALLRRPAILILDDALASVDTYTEERILGGLGNYTTAS